MNRKQSFKTLEELRTLLPESMRKEELISPSKEAHDGKGKTVRVLLEKKGRKGKKVTLVTGLQHNPATMEDLARTLKKYCGAGGTVKDGEIEVQGDQKEKVTQKLRAMNYVVN